MQSSTYPECLVLGGSPAWDSRATRARVGNACNPRDATRIAWHGTAGGTYFKSCMFYFCFLSIIGAAGCCSRRRGAVLADRYKTQYAPAVSGYSPTLTHHSTREAERAHDARARAKEACASGERARGSLMGSVAVDSDYGAPRELSPLQKARALYNPELPPCLQGTAVTAEYGDAATAADLAGAHVISQAFPHTYGQPLVHFLGKTRADVPDASVVTEHSAVRVGVVFSGRQSPGGHNVIWGLYDAIKAHNSNSKLIGFLGGTDGLFLQKTIEITDEALSCYKNQGGYDMLGRTRDQIRTIDQVKAAMNTCQFLKLNALVIIGGVTSNTDAAQLAETFAESKCSTKIVGVPVTLNGDLKNQFVETTVGFDTICKVNSQLISNACTDALSAEKVRSTRYHPNVILGEEVAASKLTIFDITKQICDAVQARYEKGKHHGVVLIPEGLVESIPELYSLLQEIHGLHIRGVPTESISSQLSPWASALLEFLPPFIRKQLLLHPGSDDSAQLSQIETEKLLAQLVENEMNKRQKEGTYKGKKFNAICHFFGYQARGALPSKFDCDYAYVLGHVCYHIIEAGLNGYMATVTNLKSPMNKWKCGAVPITVKSIVKPGCSQDILKAALSAMAYVTDMLTIMSSPSFAGQATI
ncbi:hypothetical protein PR202_gb17065 [Eleusine coracana subsp. coracana]|uniref:Phosphofructokinase domain-containing protein n=1 Tax=Eleusine coracana subsp. coracana TaxID=191504 RepID=A0AAV5F201_ELECO|nr:hypothetical protein PR202_gb17065 [Eleusine coracana subsp. coracana]